MSPIMIDGRPQILADMVIHSVKDALAQPTEHQANTVLVRMIRTMNRTLKHYGHHRHTAFGMRVRALILFIRQHPGVTLKAHGPFADIYEWNKPSRLARMSNWERLVVERLKALHLWASHADPDDTPPYPTPVVSSDDILTEMVLHSVREAVALPTYELAEIELRRMQRLVNGTLVVHGRGKTTRFTRWVTTMVLDIRDRPYRELARYSALGVWAPPNAAGVV